ncbi:YitT family protein [Nocardia sp. NPDC059240]|uniref:YczE/YyaS/YitT family protein n=1 Tax=Nocardia sp. NPDC059240 TaxID=3346786 RepID=UPI0036BB7E3C
MHDKDAGVIDTGNTVRRWITYIAGIYILTMGLSLAVRAGIGISPQSSLTRTMTLVVPRLSQGNFNLMLEVIALLATFAVRPREFKAGNLLSLVPALILAVLLDFNLRHTAWLTLGAYPAKVALLFAADAMLAFGLFLMIRANLVLMPIDMFVNTVQRVTGRKWGNIKTVFDCTLLALSASIGVIFLGAPHFIREGTILNAILVGQYVKIYFFLYRRYTVRRRSSEPPKPVAGSAVRGGEE